MIPWYLIVTFIVFDLIFVSLVITGLVRMNWTGLAKSYPPVAPDADAVEKKFQSIKLGMCNFGSCIHIAADERFLHLTPASLMQKLGATPISIPWTDIRIVKLGTKWSKVTVQRQTLQGPAWCLNLAAPEEAVEGKSSSEPVAKAESTERTRWGI
jgi:hypothetical protein